jgi:hypothetical protein
MIAVPAVKIFDQLTLYVSVSPGWNARTCGEREPANGASPLKTPEMGASPNARVHRTMNFRKKARDVIFKRPLIIKGIRITGTGTNPQYIAILITAIVVFFL